MSPCESGANLSQFIVFVRPSAAGSRCTLRRRSAPNPRVARNTLPSEHVVHCPAAGHWCGDRPVREFERPEPGRREELQFHQCRFLCVRGQRVERQERHTDQQQAPIHRPHELLPVACSAHATLLMAWIHGRSKGLGGRIPAWNSGCRNRTNPVRIKKGMRR